MKRYHATISPALHACQEIMQNGSRRRRKHLHLQLRYISALYSIQDDLDSMAVSRHRPRHADIETYYSLPRASRDKKLPHYGARH